MAYATHEQETICLYDYDANQWTIYSRVRKHITKLRRQFGEPIWVETEPDKNGQSRIVAARWVVPGNAVSFTKGRRKGNEQ